jgi:hypothetical protein
MSAHRGRSFRALRRRRDEAKARGEAFHACPVRVKIPLGLLPFFEQHGNGKQRKCIAGGKALAQALVRKIEYDNAVEAFKKIMQEKLEAAKLEQQIKAAQADTGPAAIAAAVSEPPG